MRKSQALDVGILATILVAVGGLSAPGPTPPPPPPRQAPDERQAAMMKKMGYVWDGERWGRGNQEAYRQREASCRSGNRFIRFIDEDGTPATSDAALVATKRFGEVLQEAREKALPKTSDQQLAFARDWKNFLSRPVYAPLAWISFQACTFVALSYVGGVDWSIEFERCTPGSIGIGLLLGGIAAECRSRARTGQPGVEEPDGALERLVADGMDGNFALPAPAHIRSNSIQNVKTRNQIKKWPALALSGELLAAINVSMCLNTILQPYFLRMSSDAIVWKLVDVTSSTPWLGQSVALVGAGGAALVVSLPAWARAVRHSRAPLDGIPAECEAATRTNKGAIVYFNMCPPTQANALEAANALQVLASGWDTKFGDMMRSSPPWQEPLFAFLGSFACACAWQISGGAIVAPFIARSVSSIDTYFIRPDEDSNLVSVLLPKSQLQRDKNELEPTEDHFR
jgi:hypothetical protein